ncbi:MAG: SMP-30/gluconolactonase/LRE family protein [Pseudomonadota bacterium]
MSHSTPQVAFDQAMQVGECPMWHPEEAAVYWVDIEGKAIHRLHPASGAHRVWPMPTEPATLARAQTGGLIVALRSGFAHLDTTTGTLTEIVKAPYDTATTRFNDGRCDAAGRFWVGTIYEPRDQQAAEMYCLERGALRKVWSGGTTVSNGLGFSPDNTTLYHSDTTAHVIRRHALNLTDGTVGPAQLLKQFSTDKANNYGGRPDGAAVDSEGAYWCAMFEGGRLLRLSPQGELLQEINLPVRCPTMLAFGGEDLRTLYITSAGKRPEAELVQFPLSGRLLSLTVEVAGRVEHAYRT